MNCKNHEAEEAVDRCVGCAEAFCPYCLVTVQGQKYCAACKVMVVKGPPVMTIAEGEEPCEEANEALKYGLISLFCLGFITGPMAISKALEAKKQIKADPDLGGTAKANAGLLFGTVGLIIWVVGLIARMKGGSQ